MKNKIKSFNAFNVKSFNDSGGVGYQMRAIWNRKRWRPFCDFVSRNISDWVQEIERSKNTTRQGLRLVLIGPNGGYTLPQNIVRQFREVVVVDPDPLGFLVFESRFSVNAKRDKKDYFGLFSEKPSPEKIIELFQKYENSAFLFCNIIGQVPVLLRGQKNIDVEAYMARLATVLEKAYGDFNIASYHDRYSRDLKKPNELVDHFTGGFFQKAKFRREFPWRMTARLEHQIEFIG